MKKILLLAQGPFVSENIASALVKEGYDVDIILDLLYLLQVASEAVVDLILLECNHDTSTVTAIGSILVHAKYNVRFLSNLPIDDRQRWIKRDQKMDNILAAIEKAFKKEAE